MKGCLPGHQINVSTVVRPVRQQNMKRLHAKLPQSSLILGDPPGSSVHGILQARIDP